MFKPRRYDPDRKDGRSAAQKAANMRNFHIFKLRGLHAQMGMLTGKRRDRARMLVDQELKALGAKTMAEHAEARDADLAARLASRNRDPSTCPDCGEPVAACDCIPF